MKDVKTVSELLLELRQHFINILKLITVKDFFIMFVIGILISIIFFPERV